MKPGLKIFLNLTAWVLDVLSIAILGWIGLALDMTPGEGVMGKLITASKENAPNLVIIFGTVLTICRVIRWRIRGKPKEALLLDRLIDDSLETFRKTCFPDLPSDEPLDNNRVTIFKRVQWKWRIKPWRSIFKPWGIGSYPGSGWLVVVYRSGHATQTSETVFLAPDNAPQAEGVAGRAWRSDGAVRLRHLPDLNRIEFFGMFRFFRIYLKSFLLNQPVDSNFRVAVESVKTYAEVAGTTEKWLWRRIKKRKQSPISIVAIPLESGKYERWGALVIDSSNNIECVSTDTPRFRIALGVLKNKLADYGVTRS